jgi:hypothetical protein
MNQETSRRGGLQDDANTAKVRKVIEDICKNAGASVAIEQRSGDGDEKQASANQHLQVTYTGEKPMPYPNWFKLVDTIDEALESSSSELIDWESSELSGENEQERMASWKIAGPASQ